MDLLFTVNISLFTGDGTAAARNARYEHFRTAALDVFIIKENTTLCPADLSVGLLLGVIRPLLIDVDADKRHSL